LHHFRLYNNNHISAKCVRNGAALYKLVQSQRNRTFAVRETPGRSPRAGLAATARAADGIIGPRRHARPCSGQGSTPRHADRPNQALPAGEYPPRAAQAPVNRA